MQFFEAINSKEFSIKICAMFIFLLFLKFISFNQNFYYVVIFKEAIHQRTKILDFQIIFVQTGLKNIEIKPRATHLISIPFAWKITIFRTEFSYTFSQSFATATPRA